MIPESEIPRQGTMASKEGDCKTTVLIIPKEGDPKTVPEPPKEGDEKGRSKKLSFNLKKSLYISDLRRACNIIGVEEAASILGVPRKRIGRIHSLSINGSAKMAQFLEADDKQFGELILMPLFLPDQHLPNVRQGCSRLQAGGELAANPKTFKGNGLQSLYNNDMDARVQKKKETAKRHKGMGVHVFDLKFDKSSLNAIQGDCLDRILLEAKWFYNHCIDCLNHRALNEVDTTAKTVKVRMGDGSYEERPLVVLPAACKQAIVQRIFNALMALKELRKQGKKTGDIGFKGKFESVPFPQIGNHGACQIIFPSNRVRIANCTKPFRVKGLEQIPEGAELANASLLSKHGEWYFQVTCYVERDPVEEAKIEEFRKDNAVGLDFGCGKQIVLYDDKGTCAEMEFELKIDKKLRRQHRSLSRKQRFAKEKAAETKTAEVKVETVGTKIKSKIKTRIKESANCKKDRIRLQRSYAKRTAILDDIRNKVVTILVEWYGTICVQDENIKGWQAGGHGRKIQNTGIGGIIAALKNKARTPVVVDRCEATTKTCSICGNKKKKMEQWERIYICEECIARMDRDANSARDILIVGLDQIGSHIKVKDGFAVKGSKGIVVSKGIVAGVSSEFTPGETGASASDLIEKLRLIPHVRCKPLSLNQEAPAFRRE